MTRPDDPEMLNCTCVHRKLKSINEAVIFYCPGGTILVFARDCPEHGARFEEDAAVPENVG